MIYELETQEMLRVLAKFYPVYQILWNGPTELTEIKRILMEYYEMAESTARTYINAICAEKAGPICLKKDGTVCVDKEQVIYLEEVLQNIFDWDMFDPRHDKYMECNAQRIQLDLKCQELDHMLNEEYMDKKKIKKSLETRITELEGALREKNIELDNANKELDRVKEQVEDILRLSVWQFFWCWSKSKLKSDATSMEQEVEKFCSRKK